MPECGYLAVVVLLGFLGWRRPTRAGNTTRGKGAPPPPRGAGMPCWESAHMATAPPLVARRVVAAEGLPRAYRVGVEADPRCVHLKPRRSLLLLLLTHELLLLMLLLMLVLLKALLLLLLLVRELLLLLGGGAAQVSAWRAPRPKRGGPGRRRAAAATATATRSVHRLRLIPVLLLLQPPRQYFVG